MFASKDVFLKSSGGYTIARSVRLRSSANAYLNRTPATAGNRKTWTWSGWTKRGNMATGAAQFLFTARSGSPWGGIVLENSTGQLQVTFTAGVSGGTYTSAYYRDPSAWYHIVVAVDTTQATAADRIKVYVNGVQVTSFSSTNYPSQNFDTQFNSAIAHYLGCSQSSTENVDGYLTEVNFIDGQALTPSSFGETDAIIGAWKPKKYSGTYGTNGFYLRFADNSTAAALGTDSSGNSNTWTVNNISVTAGATYDSMTDVPTLTSATAANYPTLSPLIGTASANYTLNDGNLKLASSAMTGHINATMAATSGKYYWECIVVSVSSNNDFSVGVDIYGTASLSASMGQSAGSYTIYSYSGNTYLQKRTNSSGTLTNTTAAVTGDIIMVAMDVGAGYVWWGKNGTWIDSGNPATGANPMYTGLTGTLIPGVNGGGGSTSTTTLSHNFGQQGFTYTPPSGFVALNTYNLSTPTIPNGAVYMAATLYTGTGVALTVANTVNGTSFQPDFVWGKSRSAVGSHTLTDSVRGVNSQLFANATAAQNTNTDNLTAFNSNGFSFGTSSNYNGSGTTFVAWNWKANGTGVSNTDGTITSTVSANTTAGFSVVTYTGTGANATVGHGLGVAPSMIIAKSRSISGAQWAVYTTTLGASAFINLDSTAAATTGNTSVWQGVSPTSTVFSVSTSNQANGSAATYVAYVFAAVAGYSAFGSYTGNGSTDGPFVYLGFRPRFTLIKRTDAIANWRIHDTARDTYNVASKTLYPNLNNSETSAASEYWDILSNGIKLRTSDAESNASGGTYIYMCFAENPFKYSLAR